MDGDFEQVITSQRRDLGGGVVVWRSLPSHARKMVGPFVFVDHHGPGRLPPGHGMDVRPHPHIGIATLTYLFEGEIVHRDSLGVVQRIVPGEVNWMVAGRGIVHSERSPDELRPLGAPGFGVQTWLALPQEHEETEPAFSHHARGDIPRFSRDGAEVAVIAGTAFGERSPVPVFSDTLYVAVDLEPGGTLEVSSEHEERAVYVLLGAVTLGARRCETGQLAVLAPGRSVRIDAPDGAKCLLIGGARLDGPRHLYWNFVSSSRERIERAKSDWLERRFPEVPGETEFIPLPAP
jgi:redox-sensitive bicupin YhaK (pirin superfamily)